MRFRPAAIVTLLLVLPFAVGRSAIVKCQDAAGHWHYGDVSGSTCRGRPHYVLNTEGLEIAAPPAVRATSKPNRHASDQLLLATYGSLDDLRQAQTRALAGLAGERSGIRETLAILERTLARMQSLAMLSHAPPAELERNIADTNDQIRVQKQALSALDSQIAHTRAHYAAMIERYQALQAPLSH